MIKKILIKVYISFFKAISENTFQSIFEANKKIACLSYGKVYNKNSEWSFEFVRKKCYSLHVRNLMYRLSKSRRNRK